MSSIIHELPQLSFEDVKNKIDIILTQPDAFMERVTLSVPSAASTITRLTEIMDLLISENKELNETPQLTGRQLADIKTILCLVPYLVLEQRSPNTEECCRAFVLLCQNYCSAFPDKTEEINKISNEVYNIFVMENKLTNLILVADIILNRCDNLIQTQTNYYGVSSHFLKKLEEEMN